MMHRMVEVGLWHATHVHRVGNRLPGLRRFAR